MTRIPPVPPPLPPPRKKRSPLPWILLGLGLGMLMLVAVAFLLYLGFNGLKTREPTPREKTLVLAWTNLVPYGVNQLNRKDCEVYSAVLNLDGSLEINYEFDSSLNPDNEDDYLYILSSAEVSRTRKGARESFVMYTGAYKASLTLLGDSTVEKGSEPLQIGDSAYHGVVKQEGEPVGNIVIVREGRITLTLFAFGLFLEHADDVRALMEPIVKKAVAFQEK